MIVEWFDPPRQAFTWFGMTVGTMTAVSRGGSSAVAAIVGPPGPQGPAGMGGTGEVIEGPQGVQGETGAQGPQGVDGSDGADGVQGPKGDIGPPGADGSNGNDGADGADGIQGVKGDTGDAGPQGEQGPQGIQGETGPAGADGTGGAGGTPQEVIDARGGRPVLNDRITTISNFASPNVGSYISGQYYDAAFTGGSSSLLTGVAGQLDLGPFYTSQAFTTDQVGVSVTTTAAGGFGRVAVYGSDANGWPSDLLYYGAEDLDMSSTGYKFHSDPLTLDAGRQYWMGFHHSSVARIRGISTSSAKNLGIVNANSTAQYTILRKAVPYGAAPAAPASWTFDAGERLGNTPPPSVRFRIA